MIDVDDLTYPKGKDGKAICQECGGEFKLITPAHLRSHNITMAEYKLKYPECPISGAEYKASRYTFKDSILFKNMEGIPSTPIEEDEVVVDNRIKHSVINYERVPKNKADILKFLHDAYPYLQDNYSIEKRHFYDDRLLWKYITDMADPVKKVIFDFPNSFWHNQDAYPDPHKYNVLREDGWILIVVDKHYPTAKDVFQDTDIISD